MFLAEVAIYAVAVVKTFLFHLEVDVGCAGLDRIGHDRGDELGHWLAVFGGDIEVANLVIHILDIDRFEFRA